MGGSKRDKKDRGLCNSVFTCEIIDALISDWYLFRILAYVKYVEAQEIEWKAFECNTFN